MLETQEVTMKKVTPNCLVGMLKKEFGSKKLNSERVTEILDSFQYNFE